ncbi:TPA: hypothetical protein L4W69_005411, partial [Pseudomonas aeruginosa]|nr:hypothetical protein [Pseudomonas aeruginosa]
MKSTFDEKKQPKALVDITEDGTAEMFQGEAVSEDAAEDLPNDGWSSPQQNTEKNYDIFFSFIREKHLSEAQEFRRQGYNSKEPEVDPGLMPQLRDAVDVASRLVRQHTSEKEQLGQWLRKQIRQFEKFLNRLSGGVIQEWVSDELTKERLLASGLDSSLNKSAAQSLARRLESTLQALTGAARTLGAIVDHSSPDNLHRAVHEVLVNELTEAISPSDRESVMRALTKMEADPASNAAWTKLMDARVTAWEISKPATFDVVINALRGDAKEANKKARELSGSAQAFFSDIAAFLLLLSSEIKSWRSTSAERAIVENRETQNEEAVAFQERIKKSHQKLRTIVSQGIIQLHILGDKVSKNGRRAARAIKYGDTKVTPSKTADRGVADSITRSILWQWQQPAVKLEYASGAIFSKVAELRKIQGLFSSTDAVNASGNAEDNDVVAASEPHDVDTQLRKWLYDRVEQELPGNQQAAKLAVLSRLLDDDIASARRLIARLGKTKDDIENMLKRQRVAVVNMIYERRSAGIDTALKDMNIALPKIASDLSVAVAALDRALQAAEQPNRDFSTAKTHAREAQLRATEAKESISTLSITHTERPLDELSRGARLAKHWAYLAKERSSGHWQAPDAKKVWTALKNQGLLDATISTGDPDGYLFATRLAVELENAQNDELKLPMSPGEYVALEKSLVESIVSWGQRRITQGITRVVIELIFEAAHTVSISWRRVIGVPYKILKASIKIPYHLTKVNNYTMPGQDRPYIAIYDMLVKKLKQLGFNLVMTPLPGIIKLPIGIGVVAGAALRNRQIGSQERTFSAVYEAVTQGKKSEKFKMKSLTGTAIDGVVDASSLMAFKGVSKGIASIRTRSVDPGKMNVQLMPPIDYVNSAPSTVPKYAREDPSELPGWRKEQGSTFKQAISVQHKRRVRRSPDAQVMLPKLSQGNGSATALDEQDEAQQQPRDELIAPLVGACEVNDYFLKKNRASVDARKDALIRKIVTASDINADERNVAHDGSVYLWETGKPGRVKLTIGQYLNDNIYLDSKYQAMILPKDYIFPDMNSVPTEDDRRWPDFEVLCRSKHIRKVFQNIFSDISDVDAEALRSKSDKLTELKSFSQGAERWETDNHQIFALQGARDLVAGEKILVSVKDKQGLEEYAEITVPAKGFSRYTWPTYVASEINSKMTLVRVGDIFGQGQSASIDLKVGEENYVWTMNGQVMEWQILRGGTSAALPAQDNAHWRVPASDTWPTTPPRLALPRSASADECLVVWVEDRKSGTLIERLEVPIMHEPDVAALSQKINESSDHLRVGELSKGEIVPTNAAEMNIFWVDHDDYIVKYVLVPAESLDENLKREQTYQLLVQLNAYREETINFLSSRKRHPYTALDRAEIHRLLSLNREDVSREIIRVSDSYHADGIAFPAAWDIPWINDEKTLIGDCVSFRASLPVSGTAAENESFAAAKTDAVRYFLYKNPTLAEGTSISSTTVDRHQLLAAANDIFTRMSSKQQNDFIFVTALYWKLAATPSFGNRVSSLTNGKSLELFGLREEAISDYEDAILKEFSVNHEVTGAYFKTRVQCSSDEEYFKQYADYLENTLGDESKRMSSYQMYQTGLSSFDMNRPVAKSIKITMGVPVYTTISSTYGSELRFTQRPAIGDIQLFKTDSGRYFIYSSVGNSPFLKEVKENFSEAELSGMLNGVIEENSAKKLESLFRKSISLDDVDAEGGYGSFNSAKRQFDKPSLGYYTFSATTETPQILQVKLELLNSKYIRRIMTQYREQNFTQTNWEKFCDSIIPFYKRWSRSSKDPTYVHSEEDSYYDLISLLGFFSVVSAGGSGVAKAGRALSGVLRVGRPVNARGMLLLLERGARAAAPGLREAFQGMASQLASEMFPPLDLARAARAGGRYVVDGARRAIKRGRNIVDGSGQSLATRNPFHAQNSVSIDLSNASRLEPLRQVPTGKVGNLA